MIDYVWRIDFEARAEISVFEEDFVLDNKEFKLKICIGEQIIRPVSSSTINLSRPNKPSFALKIQYFDYISESYEIAEIKALKSINNVIYTLADQHGMVIESIVRKAIFSKGKQINSSAQLPILTFDDKALSHSQQEDMKKLLQDDTYIKFLNENSMEKTYRDILFSVEDIGGYIAMYSLLLSLVPHNPKNNFALQDDVDNFIRQIKDRIDYNTDDDRPSTKNASKQETIYTWLRNQIGHIQNDTEYNEVVLNIKKHYPELVLLVSLAMHSAFLKNRD